MANTASIGKDTNTSGNSLITSGGIWQAVTDGNLMIRSILYYMEGRFSYGDVDSNGVIDAYDASLVLMNAVGMITPVEPFPEVIGDVDGNGNVEAYDAALILQFVVGLIDIFPVETRADEIPSAMLDYYLDGSDLVITATGELYAAELEFPFTIRNESVNPAFMNMIHGNKVAMASAKPVSGEIMRLSISKEEIEGAVIITSANSIRGEIRCREPLLKAEIKSVYPNPFNPETTINYTVPLRGAIEIAIYNCRGQRVETLLKGEVEAGSYQMKWNAIGRASGIYFVRMNSLGNIIQEKIILLK
jgi:hypothetical protein